MGHDQMKSLQAGDWVRVRTAAEIAATLDGDGALRGCSFTKAMNAYCGTRQRVLKPVERFVDEQEQRVKTCRGLVLLDGVMCDGDTAAGRCDKSCYLFWREEWLEKEASR